VLQYWSIESNKAINEPRDIASYCHSDRLAEFSASMLSLAEENISVAKMSSTAIARQPQWPNCLNDDNVLTWCDTCNKSHQIGSLEAFFKIEY